MEYFIVSKGVMFETIFEILRNKVKENVKYSFYMMMQDLSIPLIVN